MGNLKGKRVLVTGGNGYLGAHLVAALKDEGAVVSIIDRISTGSTDEYIVDITKELEVNAAIDKIEPQIIYHLAATLHRDRNFEHHDTVMKINYTGTINLLRALEHIPYENFIFTSSSEIYGSNQAPFNENQLPAPASPYSMSKVFGEIAIKTFSELHKKDYTILRLFNFFGKNMPANFFIPQLVHSLQHDTVFNMTEGEQARDFLYIDDVIQAMILAATNEGARNNTLNVCSSQSITLKELVIAFQQRMKSSCRIDAGALQYRENEVWNMVGDDSRIKDLGFQPKYSLDQAIDQLIN